MTKITVRIIPNAHRSEVAGQEGETWKIRVTAPPIEGKANKELLRWLAETLDVAPSEIEIVKGLGSKIKTLEIPLSKQDINSALSYYVV
jgi:uncharacterized protein (TIGR00251 family)